MTAALRRIGAAWVAAAHPGRDNFTELSKPILQRF
jgi:hypothetical protein